VNRTARRRMCTDIGHHESRLQTKWQLL